MTNTQFKAIQFMAKRNEQLNNKIDMMEIEIRKLKIELKQKTEELQKVKANDFQKTV